MPANAAFEILYRDYYVRVFGLCRRLLNSTPLAEEAAQETFMRAYRHFDSFDPSRPFWQWIATIANNHCIDVLRRANQAKDLFGNESEEIEALADDDDGAEAQVMANEDREALAAAVARLPDKYRVPLVLAYFAEASYDEIASDLSISRNHVGVLLLRAKRQLRGTMAGRSDGNG